ncbi:unnamed protein product, partial [Scytosiphon promiscuus]
MSNSAASSGHRFGIISKSNNHNSGSSGGGSPHEGQGLGKFAHPPQRHRGSPPPAMTTAGGTPAEGGGGGMIGVLSARQRPADGMARSSPFFGEGAGTGSRGRGRPEEEADDEEEVGGNADPGITGPTPVESRAGKNQEEDEAGGPVREEE